MSTSLYLYFTFFTPKSSTLWPLFTHLLHYPLKRGFLLLFMFSFLFPQQSDTLWPYLPHLLHSTLKNLLLLFLHLFSLEFNTRTLSSGSYFSVLFLLLSSIFQNQRISFFRYLKFISAMFKFQGTLTCLYSSGKISKTLALSLS